MGLLSIVHKIYFYIILTHAPYACSSIVSFEVFQLRMCLRFSSSVFVLHVSPTSSHAYIYAYNGFICIDLCLSAS